MKGSLCGCGGIPALFLGGWLIQLSFANDIYENKKSSHIIYNIADDDTHAFGMRKYRRC